MAFLIETLISRILSAFIYKQIGWDESGYKGLIHRKDILIYTRYNKGFIYIKYFLFFIFVVMAFTYLFIYFYSLYNNKEYIPVLENNHVVYNLTYNDDMIYVGWVFLLFGVVFYLDIEEQIPYLFFKKSKTTVIERKNLRWSFRNPYWIVLIIASFIRIILLLSLEKAYIVMNVHNVNMNIQLHPSSTQLTYVLCACYYILIINAGLIIILSSILFLLKGHLKPEYLPFCIKNNSYVARIIARRKKWDFSKKELSNQNKNDATKLKDVN